MKKVLVPLAPGFEEIEAVTIIDVLRRAGVEVTVAGTEPGVLRGSRGIMVEPDTTLDTVDAGSFDAIALPGGLPGTITLREDPRVLEAVRRHHASGKLTAAICAAPTVLAAAGLAEGTRLTAHPSVQGELAAGGATISAERVCTDDRIVTSQGPGTSMEFAFELVARLCGPDKVAELNVGILARV